MTAPAVVVPAFLARDLCVTLHRLQQARRDEDVKEIAVCVKRLDWLIDSKLSRALKGERVC